MPSFLRRIVPFGLAISLATALAAPSPLAADDEKTSKFPDFERSENFETLSVEGWTVRVNKRLREEDRELGERTLEQLRAHLLQVKTRVPQPALKDLQSVTIWVNVREGESACYHPDAAWLAGHGHNPEKVKCVEIGDAATYLEYSKDQQSILMHELAHAYHDRILGFEEKRIEKRFEEARDAGLYDAVLKASGKTERHYALSNAKEFFAESSEAFFAVNDFYPFVRAELRKHDPKTHDLLVEIWEKGKSEEAEAERAKNP